MRRHLLSGLFLLAMGLGVVWWVRHPAPCRTPVLYTLGTIDERFQVDEATVAMALRQAEALWEEAAGRNLFRQTPHAPLRVHFVFDERQHATHVQQRLLPRLQEAEATHASLTQSYATWRQLYEDRQRAFEVAYAGYEQRAQAYNATVQEANRQRTLSPQAQRALDAERAALEASQAQLRAMEHELKETVATLRSLEARDQTLVAAYTRQVQSYNQLSRTQRQFHKGEFNGRDITIYQFQETADLVLVLAHELGHALGLKHVADERAVMHELLSKQDLDTLALTAADLQALSTACPKR